MPVMEKVGSAFLWILERVFHPVHHLWLLIRFWIGVLKPSRFPLMTVLAGAVVLIAVPQGQDLLRGLAERQADTTADSTRVLCFGLSAVLWAVSAWYWSRAMLYLQFPDVPGNEEELRAFRTAAPRIIGFIAALSIAIALFRASAGYSGNANPAKNLLRLYALWALIGAFVLLYIFIKRRDWSLAAYQKLSSIPALQSRFTTPVVSLLAVRPSADLVYGESRLRDLPRGVLVTAGASILLASGLFLVFLFGLQFAAPRIGAASILLFAAAGWTGGGSLLDIAGLRLRFPVISALLLLAILFSFWNDNHAVRTLAERPALLESRPTVVMALNDWLARQLRRPSPNGTYPLFLVAAEGGGIRAAAWTATVLTEIQDRNTCFADSLFAASGVSGGSLGSSVFLAQLADERPTQQNARCGERDVRRSGNGQLGETARRILAEDFLSPVLGAMLYPDFLQRLLPFSVPFFDRARALEGAWERAWKKHAGSSRFSDPFDGLWRQRSDLWMPALFLNATWVETGKRLIASNVRITPGDFNDAEELLALYQDRSLPLSAAVHLSARFTYVSPAATLEKEGRVLGRAVDGGYFENSGETTVMEILKTIGQLAEEKAAWRKVLPVVIHISNEPVDPQYQRIHLLIEQKDAASRPLPGLNEVLSPLITLLRTRDARGVYARESVAWHVGEQNFLHFGLCKKRLGLPLGWVISSAVQDEMLFQLRNKSCEAFDNPANVKTIDRMLRARYR